MLKYLLDQGYKAERGSREVKVALYYAVSRADVAIVNLLLDEQLVVRFSTVCYPYPTSSKKNLLGLVKSLTGDPEAVAATMDTLLAHGFEIESGEISPFPGAFNAKRGEEFENPESTDFYFQFLLDRGADPLHGAGPASPLGEAANLGYKGVVKFMLKALDRRSIPLKKLQWKLAYAEEEAKEVKYCAALAACLLAEEVSRACVSVPAQWCLKLTK